MKPTRKPPAILNQPIDPTRDPFSQARARWKALFDHYGIDPDIEHMGKGWREDLICALALDHWAGFRSSRRARGKPKAVVDPFVLLDVVAAVLDIKPTWPLFEKAITQCKSEKLAILVPMLRTEAKHLERKPSIAWLAKRLCTHPKSPWKGKRPETLRSNITKHMKVGVHWHPGEHRDTETTFFLRWTLPGPPAENFIVDDFLEDDFLGDDEVED